jgi:hypothetical protein
MGIHNAVVESRNRRKKKKKGGEAEEGEKWEYEEEGMINRKSRR